MICSWPGSLGACNALLACCLALTGAHPALAQAPDSQANVVISQVYGGGGNTGATLTSDYIELHNRTSGAVNLAGWSVQYASSTGSTWQKTDLVGTIGAGQYLLVKEAQGAGGTTGLPAPDVAGTIPMSATAGKVALVSTATLLSGTCPTGPQIVDFVGYGTANCSEGSVAVAALTNTTAALRSNAGCRDSNTNGSDFTVGAPNPRNAAAPALICAVAGPPVIPSCPASLPALLGTPTSTLLSATDQDGIVSGATILGAPVAGISLGMFIPAPGTGETAGVPLNLDGTTALGTYAVEVQFANGDAVPQTAVCTIQVTVASAQPGNVRIHDIQGARHISPLNGLAVNSVPGVVTAPATNGFYLQDPAPDSDPATSEGIFVFTGSAPTVVAGDSVLVSGTVQEFRPGGATSANLTTTEITAPVVATLSHGNTLPAPVIIGSGGRIPPSQIIDSGSCGDVEQAACGFDAVNDGIDFYESLEGMRVQVNNAVVVGPTNSFGETPVVSDFGANATQRTPRGGVYITASDFNPERIMLDDQILGTVPRLNVGDVIPTAVGVLDYSFGNFKLVVTQAYFSSSGNLQRELARAQDPGQLAIASFNVENLDIGDGPAKFDTLAGQIVTNLAAPDIIGLMEVQDDNGATNNGVVDAGVTLNALISAITAAGGPAYAYRQISPVNDQDGGEPGGNIRVAFLFNPARVGFVDRAGGTPTAATTVVDNGGTPALSFSPGRVDPANPAFVDSRKPLAGEFLFNGRKVFVIANHFNSKGGDQPLFGQFQPPALVSETQRLQQAHVVHDFVQSILAVDADANVVVLGDLNDFEFSPPLAALKAGILNDLVEQLPAAERYTYVFEGNSQVLDHILVSHNLMTAIEYDVVHVNTEFADQASDHDPEVARLYLPPTFVDVTGRISLQISGLVYNRLTQRYNGMIRIANNGATTISGPLQLELNGLDAGITLANASGTHNGSPYITHAGSLAPGAAISVPVQFSNPAKLPLIYTVKGYSGTF